ncbi:hypothetical protein NLJ89_g2342 [Agrocybe chaxingu]|uniref:DUF6533 domain-containing protein n=1 Tax=Agrocybe chaxingu TaxID=84603 RepID=A0A9W8MWK2_9AGAR|nr:hypothetical protein NLJ89_g2342 [Agrocybe chaxingu]
MTIANHVYSTALAELSSESASTEFGESFVSLLGVAAIQNYSALSAFILLVWDYMDTLTDEVEYIWGQRLTPVKFAFLFARYYGLASQLTNYVLLMTRLSRIPVAHQMCKGWYGFQTVSFWLLYTSSDLVLMMRVYALYQHSQNIGVCLLFLHTVEGIVVSLVGWHTLEHIQFNAACDAISIPPDVIAFATVVIVSQCVVWALTCYKRNVGHGQSVPVVDVVIRDGRLAWFVVCVIIAATVLPSFCRQVARPHLLFSWPITLLSVGTCRLVLNIQKVPGIQPVPPACRRPPDSSVASSGATFSSVAPSLAHRSGSHFSSEPNPFAFDWQNTPSSARSVSSIAKSENTSPKSVPSSPSIPSLHFDERSSTARTKHPGELSRFQHIDSRVSSCQSSAKARSWHSSCDIEIGSECTNTSMDSAEMREYWNELL